MSTTGDEQSSMGPRRVWVASRAGRGSEDEVGGPGGELIWVSAHDAGSAGGSFGEQFAATAQSLERTLHEAGASWDDVESVRAYLAEPGDEEEFNSTYRALFAGPLPVLTVLFGGLRAGLLFQVECVAVRPPPNMRVGA